MSDPSTILSTDLVAWYKRGTGVYDALVGGTLLTGASTDATEIGRWEDQSGNAFHALRNSAINVGQLQWSTSVTKNGQPTVHFPSSEAMTIPNGVGTALSGAGVGSIWILIKMRAKNSTTDDGLDNFSATDNPVNYGWSDNVIYDGWGSTVRKTTGTQIVDIAADFRAYSRYSASGDWANYLDNVQQFHTASNTVTFRTSGILFGANQSGLGLGAWVSEIVIAKIKPSSTQQTDMQTYLSTTAATAHPRSFASVII